MAISRILSDGVANTAISRIDGNLGIGTASPDGKLHVHTASAGSIAAVSTSDDLVVENSDHGGMSILTPDDKYGIVAFGSPSDGHGFLVDWYHAGNAGRVHTSKVGAKLELKADNSVVGLTLDGAAGSQFAEFANDIGLKSDNSIIYFGADNDIRLTHVPDTGLRLNDSMKMLFGTGSDLEIFHDGSNSYINDAGTGSLIVKSNQFIVRNAAGSENMFDATQDGAINIYYDNAAKLTTSAAGVTVSGGIIIADAGNIGSASDTNAIGITAGGVVSITATTASTSKTTGALTVAGGLSTQADLFVGDDLALDSDSAVLSFGDDQEIALTHNHNVGLKMTSTAYAPLARRGEDVFIVLDGTNAASANAGDNVIMDASAASTDVGDDILGEDEVFLHSGMQRNVIEIIGSDGTIKNSVAGFAPGAI